MGNKAIIEITELMQKEARGMVKLENKELQYLHKQLDLAHQFLVVISEIRIKLEEVPKSFNRLKAEMPLDQTISKKWFNGVFTPKLQEVINVIHEVMRRLEPGSYQHKRLKQYVNKYLEYSHALGKEAATGENLNINTSTLYRYIEDCRKQMEQASRDINLELNAGVSLINKKYVPQIEAEIHRVEDDMRKEDELSQQLEGVDEKVGS